jgi:membrane-bound inhibitor of C-type lysozyme
MLSQVIKKKNKRGVSIVIGYVLLIAVSIVMSILVYQWLKTYVPADTLHCPDGTSAFIKDVSYNCAAKTLTITLQNNGKFSLAGFFIYVSTSSESLATIDLSSKLTSGGTISGNSVWYTTSENSFSPEYPNNEKTSVFNVAAYGSTLKGLEIIPIRLQEEDNKKRIVSCSDAKIKEVLACK